MTNPIKRYEDDLPRSLGLGLLIGLLALALTVIAYTIGTHHEPAPAGAGAPTPPGGGTAAQGQQLFVQSGCGGCHAFAPAGTNGTIGPDLTNVAAAATADHNMAVPAYIRESIVNPEAFIAPGFKAGVMPTYYATKLSGTQIAQLVAYIVAGQKP